MQRRGPASITLLALSCVLAACLLLSSPPRAAAATPTDIYQYAGECVSVQDVAANRYVALQGAGYVTTPSASEATPFRMQATGLGSYLLYGPGGKMPASGLFNGVTPTARPGPPADWKLAVGVAGLRLTNVSTGLNLSVGLSNQLTQNTIPNARWSFQPATGCSTFPEINVDIDSAPAPPSSAEAEAEARGMVDAHVHLTAFEFLGGRFHCGRPWSPYGAPEALKDCPDHGIFGGLAIAENLLSTGSPTGLHVNQGWPDFGSPILQGWPRHDSLTHEGTYWKAIERSWRAGQRILVSHLVENRALCELYWLPQNSCNDMDSIRLQAQDLYALQDYIDAQFKGPGKGFFRIVKTPAEARQVIAAGKLAVIMGVETSQPFDCLYQEGAEPCTTEDVDSGLQELWDLGVRTMFVVHKFDNAFGGTAMDDDTAGILVNLGNKYMTGRWWEVEPCPQGDHDRTPVSLAGLPPSSLTALSGADQDRSAFRPELIAATDEEDLPTYPPGPVCNVRGLTELGEYLVNRMVDIGMIVETDHLSVKTRAAVLDILEQRGYSGLVTSHSWGGPESRVRLQNLGGFVSPYANTTYEYVSEWLAARATRSGNFQWGIGYGTDTNGLGTQAAPRYGGVFNNPVTYPFANFDGSATVQQSRWINRVWNFNLDGAAHYGLFPDWVEDMRHVAGQLIVDDLALGAEAYLQMWERAVAQ